MKSQKQILIIIAIIFSSMTIYAQENDTDNDISIFSKDNQYRIILNSEKNDKKLNQFLEWRFKLEETTDNIIFSDAVFKVNGGMPEHGHGLPSKPSIINKGDGNYMIKGLKFNMPGLWVINFSTIINGELHLFEYSFKI